MTTVVFSQVQAARLVRKSIVSRMVYVSIIIQEAKKIMRILRKSVKNEKGSIALEHWKLDTEYE